MLMLMLVLGQWDWLLQDEKSGFFWLENPLFLVHKTNPIESVCVFFFGSKERERERYSRVVALILYGWQWNLARNPNISRIY